MNDFALLPVLIRCALVALVGLVVGSFLTVVIHRLPVMLERAWADRQSEGTRSTRYDLVAPRSACPHCGHQLRAWENIPVLSYLILRARCSACNAAIHWRYAVVELLSALLAVFVMLRFGVSAKAIVGYVLGASLLTLAFIDAETGLLPDAITLPLIALGLAVNLAGVFVPFTSAAMGAVSAGAVLLFVLYATRAISGRDGLGLGDVKLFCALGAWLGVASFGQMFLVSFVVAATHGVLQIALGKASRNDPMPFGPFIVFAGMFTLFAGLQFPL